MLFTFKDFCHLTVFHRKKYMIIIIKKNYIICVIRNKVKCIKKNYIYYFFKFKILLNPFSFKN